MQLKRIKRHVHRGKILHIVARKHRFTIKKIAAEANYSTASFYVHVDKQDLSFEILAKYGKAMNHDFSIEFPEMADYLSSEDIGSRPKSLTYEELEKDRDHWRGKYYQVLEKHTVLLQDTLTNYVANLESASKKDLSKR